MECFVKQQVTIFFLQSVGGDREGDAALRSSKTQTQAMPDIGASKPLGQPIGLNIWRMLILVRDIE